MQVQYPFHKKVQIVLATCVLHNFIIEHNPNVEQFTNTLARKQQFYEKSYNNSNVYRLSIEYQVYLSIDYIYICIFHKYFVLNRTTKMKPCQMYYMLFKGR
ncbi:hypothetical protein EJ110_NYTH47642 [Nymphaea thermarum]|nr:hypothetical protein EJ110_NYTH47642 [Nymphaea thermarum]